VGCLPCAAVSCRCTSSAWSPAPFLVGNRRFEKILERRTLLLFLLLLLSPPAERIRRHVSREGRGGGAGGLRSCFSSGISFLFLFSALHFLLLPSSLVYLVAFFAYFFFPPPPPAHLGGTRLVKHGWRPW